MSTSGKQTASTMWAIATIVVTLVVGFLGYTALTHDGGATTTAGTPSAPSPSAPSPSGADGEGSSGVAPEAPTDSGLSPEQEQFLLTLARRDADDPMARGAVDAPVVIIEYADYRCPFCAAWGRDVQPELQRHIDDGTVRLEFRDRVLFGEDSEATALAARAAGEQGMYWEFHDAVFAAAPDSGHPDMPREKLIGIAEDVGVPDLEQFEADLDSSSLREAMEADAAEADSLGIRSTPTFLVNSSPLVGAQPAQVFHRLIEEELAAATG